MGEVRAGRKPQQQGSVNPVKEEDLEQVIGALVGNQFSVLAKEDEYDEAQMISLREPSRAGESPPETGSVRARIGSHTHGTPTPPTLYDWIKVTPKSARRMSRTEKHEGSQWHAKSTQFNTQTDAT